MRKEANIRKRTADVDLEFREADDDVDHETWLNFRRERVRAAIEELTPTQREALELAFFGGLTHVEVSEKLDIPLGTAKTRIRSALLRLRDILGDSVSELPGRAGAPGSRRMIHSDAERLLPAGAVLDDLAPDERAAYEAHRGTCADCRRLELELDHVLADLAIVVPGADAAAGPAGRHPPRPGGRGAAIGGPALRPLR